jgi:hypothetical protein
MSILIKNTETRIENLEKRLAIAKADNDDCQWTGIPAIEKNLESAKRHLSILKSDDLEKVANDMKIIMSHTQAIEDKYACRSVKFMFWLASVRAMPKGLATWIKEYTINKINAPVCSIVASPKPELEPMPGYINPHEEARVAFERQQREELIKFRNIWVDYAEHKPTRIERFKESLRIKVNKVLA